MLPLFASIVLAAPVVQPEGAPDVARFALVIGNNHALPGSNYDPLSYADDDAIRFAELFESVGARTTLVTAADRDTAERYPELARRALRPTRAALDGALDQLEEALRRLEGQRRELFFVFSGHGSITASEAYLHLFDARFSRTDLFDQILRRMPAERVHIIIDSCHAYFLVNARGARVAVADEEEDLALYPHVGFLLSTSDRREVQEWAGYRAGVFSYQLAGALRGAADVNLDGRVSYAEVHAYIVAANYAVANPAARIRPYVRRPVGEAALLDLDSVPTVNKARVDARIEGHFHLVDETRGRLLDANKPRGTTLSLVVPRRSIVLRHGDDRYALVRQTDASGHFVAGATREASKGAIADDLRAHLFALPLTTDFVRGVEAGSPQVTALKVVGEAPVAWSSDPLTLSLLGTGSAATIAGGVFAVLFDSARDEADRRPITQDNVDARGRAERWRLGMITGLAAGGALLTAGLLRALLTNDSPSPKPSVEANGLGLSGRF